MNWLSAKTPRALVDLDRVEKNTVEMSEKIRRLGAKLRPHVKTHKCAEAARFQVRGHFGGITVSTLAEARFFAAAGFRDITYAVPLSLDRIVDAAAVARDVDALHVLLDHPRTLSALEEHGRAQNVCFSAYLKVDCGYHRAGVDPKSDDAVKLALAMAASPSVDFHGILTHAGHSYAAKDRAEIREVAEQERSVMASFAERLEAAGCRPEEVSVGSTPTMSLGESLEGGDRGAPRELRVLRSLPVDDWELLARRRRVLGAREREWSVPGAGRGPHRRGRARVLEGRWGDPCPSRRRLRSAIFDAATGAPRDDLVLDSLSQEHGTLRPRTPEALDTLEVGQKLRIVPNHSCLSAALFESYSVVRGSEVVDEWRPARGW